MLLTVALSLPHLARALPTVAEALDQPAWTFGQSAGAQWTPVEPPVTTHDGVDALQAVDSTSSSTSVSTTVQGPGVLRFHWKLDAPAQQRELRVSVNNPWIGGIVFAAAVNTATPWSEVVAPLPVGPCTVTWSYVKSTTTAGISGKAWLDQVSYEGPVGETLLAEALDAPSLTFGTSGEGVWSGRFYSPSGDPADLAVLEWPSSATQSTPLTTRLETTVSGPALLRFKQRFFGSGSFTFQTLVSSTVADSTPLGVGWRERIVAVPAGPQVISWQMTKQPGAAVTAWLDEVVVQATTESELGTALDTTGVQWTSQSGTVPTTWDAAETHDGRDVVAWNAGASTAALQTSVAGPARITGWVWNPESLVVTATDPAPLGVRYAPEQAAPNSWRQFSITVPPGQHAVRWALASGVTSYPRLDEIAITPIGVTTVAEAVDSSSVTFAQTSTWAGLNDPARAFDGVDLLQSSSASSALAGSFTGAGTLTFAWNVPSAARVELDEAFAFHAQPSARWRRVRMELPAASHGANWFLPPVGLLDQVAWEPPSGAGVGAALDAADLPWVTESTEPWSVSTEGSADGVDSLRTPALKPGEVARLMTVVDCGSKARVKWRNLGPAVWVRLRVVPSGGVGVEEFDSPSAQTLPISPTWAERVIALSPPAVTLPARVIFEVTPAGNEPVPAGAVAFDQFVVEGCDRDPNVTPAVELSQTVTGPFEMVFSWAARPAPAVGAAAWVTVDGEERAAVPPDGLPTGQRQQVILTEHKPGPHVVEWAWMKDVLNPLDGVQVRAFGAPGTLSAALDSTEIDASVAGPADIGGPAAVGTTWDGVDAVRWKPRQARFLVWCDGGKFIRWRWRSEDPLYALVASVVGGPSDMNLFRWKPGVWSPESVVLLPGRMRLAVGLDPNAPTSAQTWLDAVEVTDNAVLPLGTVLGDATTPWNVQPSGGLVPVPNIYGLLEGDRDGVSLEASAMAASITSQVTGPGLLRVLALGQGITSLLDGVEGPVIQTSSPTGENLPTWLSIPAGPHIVGARVAQRGSTLVTLRFTALVSELTLGEALDSPEVTFTQGGDASWYGVPESAYSADGVDAVFAAPGPGQAAWMELTLSGSASLRFKMRGGAQVSVDGQATYLRSDALTEHTFTVEGAGSHTVRWTHSVDAGDPVPRVTWIDELRISPRSSTGIPAALDAPSLAVVPSPAPDSVLRSSTELVPFAGADFAILPSQAASLSFPVTGPAIVTFAWQTMMPGNPRVAVAVDDGPEVIYETFTSARLREGWFRCAAHVPAGQHQLRIGASTATALDALRVSPVLPVSALDVPGAISWQPDASSGWFADAAGTIGHQPVAKPGRSTISARITGPGTLRFGVLARDLIAPGAQIVFAVDGAPLDVTREGLTAQVMIPDGLHLLNWELTPGLTGDTDPERFWLSDVSWSPGLNPLAVATGAPELAWVLSVDGVNSFSVGNDDPFQPSRPYLRLTRSSLEGSIFSPPGVFAALPGPGLLSGAGRATNSPAWGSGTSEVGRPMMATMMATPTDPGYSADLSSVVWTSLPAGSWNRAVDNSVPVFSSSAPENWRSSTTPSRTLDGEDALVLTDQTFTTDQYALTCSVTGPGTLRFAWRAFDAASITLAVDDVPTSRVAPRVWQELDVHLSAGVHRLVFSRPGTDSPHGEAASLDRFRFFPSSAPQHIPTGDFGVTAMVCASNAWQRSVREGKPVLQTAGSASTAAEDLTVIVPGETYFTFTEAASTPGAIFVPKTSDLPGLRHRSWSTSNTANRFEQWVFGSAPRRATIGAVNAAITANLATAGWVTVSDLQAVPLVPVPLSDALDLQVPVTSVPAGAWQGVRAGQFGPDVARAAGGATATLRLTLPRAAQLQSLVNGESAQLRLMLGTQLISSFNAVNTNPGLLASGAPFSANASPTVVLQSASSGTWAIADEIGVIETSPANLGFALWQQIYELSGGFANADADPDRDGVPNLVEYATGSDPTAASAPLLLQLTPSLTGGSPGAYPVLSWDVQNRPDLSYTVEMWQPSAQGGAWVTAPAVVSYDVQATGGLHYTAVASAPLAGTQMWRLRVSVSNPAP